MGRVYEVWEGDIVRIVSPQQAQVDTAPHWRSLFGTHHRRSSWVASTFGLSDVLVRDLPDNSLIPLWYHLEGGDAVEKSRVSSDIRIFVLIGTQAQDLHTTLDLPPLTLRVVRLKAHYVWTW
ncbi:hypothetical protein NL676_005603 [Syzygium grande]|nr:hypothetical protein NL676_005603 [Syzygium grande]